MKNTKNKLSFFALLVIVIIYIGYRYSYTNANSTLPVKQTTWDSFGYYMYLPAIFIYHDVTELSWLNSIDQKYDLIGGELYQARKQANGKYFFKYLGGIAVLQSPFFFVAHAIALLSDYEADGFSAPYQWAVAVGTLLYFILALIVLRKLLLVYFKDRTVAIVLLLLTLASNLIQYIAIDAGQSHGYLFPLYAFMLYTTYKWHLKPQFKWAILSGLIIGIATIGRPTEAIMIFIPLLWDTHTKESAKQKWQKVYKNRKQIYTFLIFGFIGILPQIIYWKYATGSFIYNVGSKWDFLTPHFRVLFGWEKGWFIYTPVTLLFVGGLFFIKKFPFRKSVITFCLLNIYIIISWHIWRYGGSYSTRALVQSYPVFALALAGIIESIEITKWKYLLYLIGIYLIGLNLFQIGQYNKTILHYDDMNRKYYAAIYLDPYPTPIDMSLLDTKEILKSENAFTKNVLLETNMTKSLEASAHEKLQLANIKLAEVFDFGVNENWLKIELTLKSDIGFGSSHIVSELILPDTIKSKNIRINSPINFRGQYGDYAFYVNVPDDFKECEFQLSINAESGYIGFIKYLKITSLGKF